MRTILISLAVASLCASDTSLIVFGASYHQDRDAGYQEINPGLGIDHVFDGDGKANVMASAGAYRDSYGELAAFAMPGIRFQRANWCADASAGYYRGSGLPGLGAIATVGIRATDRIWIHATATPTPGNLTFGFFARVEL